MCAGGRRGRVAWSGAHVLKNAARAIGSKKRDVQESLAKLNEDRGLVEFVKQEQEYFGQVY